MNMISDCWFINFVISVHFFAHVYAMEFLLQRKNSAWTTRIGFMSTQRKTKEKSAITERMASLVDLHKVCNQLSFICMRRRMTYLSTIRKHSKNMAPNLTIGTAILKERMLSRSCMMFLNPIIWGVRLKSKLLTWDKSYLDLMNGTGITFLRAHQMRSWICLWVEVSVIYLTASDLNLFWTIYKLIFTRSFDRANISLSRCILWSICPLHSNHLEAKTDVHLSTV